MMMRKIGFLYLLLFFTITIPSIKGQSVSFSLKTSPAINLDFNTVQKYVSGITVMNVCELNIDAVGTQWDH
jgi:hypothetical protein